jgi:D-methionine transport system permease protein
VIHQPRGDQEKVRTQYPAKLGTDEYVETAIDFYSLTYNYNPRTKTEEKQFPDQYTTYSYRYGGLSMVENSFVIGLIATVIAYLIGLPLGILLVTGDENGIRPLPKLLMKIINVVINFLRSVPFLILIVVVIPLTRALVGTATGSVAIIVPLVVAAFPFVARLVESSLRELDPNIIEMAQSMGSSTWQIILRVMLPESVPSLVTNFTLAITTILGYTAMSGAMGGGGLGKIAINYGYSRYKYAVLYLAVIVLVLLVQIFQTIGTRLAARLDKRIKK